MKAKKSIFFLLIVLITLFLASCDELSNEENGNEENNENTAVQFGQVAASLSFRAEEDIQISYEEAAQLVATHMSENLDVSVEDLVALVDFFTFTHFDADPRIEVLVSLSMGHISRFDVMYLGVLDPQTGELVRVTGPGGHGMWPGGHSIPIEGLAFDDMVNSSNVFLLETWIPDQTDWPDGAYADRIALSDEIANPVEGHINFLCAHTLNIFPVMVFGLDTGNTRIHYNSIHLEDGSIQAVFDSDRPSVTIGVRHFFN